MDSASGLDACSGVTRKHGRDMASCEVPDKNKGNVSMNLQALQKTFQSPRACFRGKPFWSWNGRLEPGELRRQIRILKQMGMGGFFMHSRVGLETPYLSRAWFDCIDTCIDEAKKLNMEAWLYDEDRWPSGAAGGLVTRNPRYRQRFLIMREITRAADFRWRTETLAAFTARIKGHAATQVNQIPHGRSVSSLLKGEIILEFCAYTAPLKDWYNGFTYLDTLNHKAVKKFIEVTHEAYRRRHGKHFGRIIPGIFTDEPAHAYICAEQPWARGIGAPWTDLLPHVFRKRYGYDLLPHLVELFFDVDGQPFTPARYHFHECVTFLFVDAFARQIGEWCGRNGMMLTGHVLLEDTLSRQTLAVGDCMRFYEHMQAPGMDLLCEHLRYWDTAKQVSSVARQFGRKWRLTETYGTTGWDFPFAGHKALGDWQAALGINLRNHHLAWYTMEGEAKRDYPASIFYQSPWWHLYPKVEDYYARVNAVMTRGVEVRDLLVIHPVESMWLRCRKGWRDDGAIAVDRHDKVLADLRDSLLAANIDFDYGNEEIMARHGAVTRKDGRTVLRVGRAYYKAVIVPPLLTIRKSTLDLLLRFRAAGGTVVFAGQAPRFVEAVPSGEAAALARRCWRTSSKGPSVAQAVETAARRISIIDAHGRELAPTLYLLREDAEAFYLFVCNTGHNLSSKRYLRDLPVRKRTLCFPDVRIRGFSVCRGTPVEFQPDTGKISVARAQRKKGAWEIQTSLPALGSRLFAIPKRKSDIRLPQQQPLRSVGARLLGGQSWKILLSEDNNLALDRPCCRIGKGSLQAPEDILRVDQRIRRALGIKPRGGAMVQPWARRKKENPKKTDVALEYVFDVRALPSGTLYLALERPETFSARLNGVPLNMDMESGWWVDRSVRKIPFDASLLKLGKNCLALDGVYDENHSGLETVYLLGRFGVKVEGVNVAMLRMPETLRLGDWTPQGLPFYSGSVSYCRELNLQSVKGRRLWIEVPDYCGVGVRILVNGQSAGIIGWAPNEVEITDWIGKGRVELRIEILGHRRNSHGPLHYFEKWPDWTGPIHFVSSGNKWVDTYQLVPCGLMKAPRLIMREAL